MNDKFYLPWENQIDTAFMKDAACRGMNPEFFMPGVGESGKEAKEICNGTPATRYKPGKPECPVRQQCLDYSLQLPGPVHGIFGGRTERERRTLRPNAPVQLKRRVYHGTDAGYEHHRRRGTTPCQACKEAHSKAVHAWRSRKNDGTTIPALQALVELVHAENARASRNTTRS